MALLPDPSAFALAVAVGCTHVLGSVLGFLDRAAAARRAPVLAALLALPVVAAYLAAVTLAFAVRVAAGVVCGTDAAVAQHAVAAALRWLTDLAVRLAIPALLFGTSLTFTCAAAAQSTAATRMAGARR